MSDHKTKSGDIGEKVVRDVLVSLKSEKIISGFISSRNLYYYGKNFQIDFVVFIPKIGLLLIEVKNWKGEVKVTYKDKWTQVVGEEISEFQNGSNQVLRTSNLLLQILEKMGKNIYPIRPLVVFSNDKVKLLKGVKNLAPQTSVIKVDMIRDWIKKNSENDIFYDIPLSTFTKIKDIIIGYSKEYDGR